MYELSKEVEEYQAKVREYAQTVVKDYAKKWMRQTMEEKR